MNQWIKVANNIWLSARNIDYAGYDPAGDWVKIQDTKLIEIFISRLNLRQREFNPMAQSTRPELFIDSSSDEIRRIDSIDDLDIEDQ